MERPSICSFRIIQIIRRNTDSLKTSKLIKISGRYSGCTQSSPRLYSLPRVLDKEIWQYMICHQASTGEEPAWKQPVSTGFDIAYTIQWKWWYLPGRMQDIVEPYIISTMKLRLLFISIPFIIFSVCAHPDKARDKPNILFCIMYTNAYTPNAKCAPSRLYVLKGRNSWQLEDAANHVVNFPVNLRPFRK